MKRQRWYIPVGLWLIFESIAVILWLTKEQIFYLVQFFLHRYRAGSWTAALSNELSICQTYGTTIGWSLYVRVFGIDLRRKYADRGILVLSVYRCI